MRYPKPKPLSFVELQARVSAVREGRSHDPSATTKANAILHAHYSDQLNRRKLDQSRRMSEAIRVSGYKGSTHPQKPDPGVAS